MENKETVCAVVVTYNRKKLLMECLDSLLKQTRPLDAIYIIDNASTDGTQEALKDFSAQGTAIHYTRMSENTGGAGGFYEGVKRGYEKGYDWLWLMDDDSEPLPDSLEILLKEKDRISGSASFAALKIGVDGNTQEHHCGYIDKRTFASTPLSQDRYKNGECLVRVDYSSFVGFLIPLRVVKKSGFPNKDFFIWNDDIEYCIRISSVGGIYLNKKAVIRHKEMSEDDSGKGRFLFLTSRATRIDIANFWKRYYYLRNLLYILKRYDKNLLAGYGACLVLYLRTIAGILIYDNFKSARLQLIFKSLVDGIGGKMGKTVDPAAWKSRFSKS